MLTKYQIKECLNGQATPLVPAWLFWLDEKLINKNIEEYKLLQECYEDDFFLTMPYLKKMSRDSELEENEFTDVWGCKFKMAQDGVGAHPSAPIINSIDDWEKYIASDLPIIDRDNYAAETQQISSENPDKYITLNIWRTFYERMYMLAGMESILMDIASEQEMILRMIPVLRDFTIQCIELASKAGADAVYLADDWGVQDRLQISPSSWRKYFKPSYAAMIETAHYLGMDVWMHSCGRITDLIPEWIDLKLDVISNLQTSALNLPLIAEKFRRKITFFGGFDCNHNLIYGTRESIRKEVEDLMMMFRAHEGKYMASPCTSIMPETPFQNVWILFEAIREFGTMK